MHRYPGPRLSGVLILVALLSGAPAIAADQAAEIAELKLRLQRLEHDRARPFETSPPNIPQELERLPSPQQVSFPLESLTPKPSDAKAAGDKAEKPSDGYEIGTDLAFKARWKDGLFFETAHGDFKSHWGTLIQQDWVWFHEDAAMMAPQPAGVGNIQDGIFFRRARVHTDGVLYDVMEWDFDCELIANNNVTFDDLWLGLTQLPIVGNTRVGHIKIPMGLESVTSNRVFTFVERACMFDAFLPEYGPGIVGFNNYHDGRATWHAAFHRLDPTGNGTALGDGDYNGTFRHTFMPYCTSDDRYYTHLGAAYSRRAAVNGQVQFQARPEFRDAQSLPRFVNTGVFNADSYDLMQCEAAWIHGPLSVQGEFIAASVNDASVNGNNLGNETFQGGYAFVSYFWTDESRPYDHRIGRFARVRPYENFFLVRRSPDAHNGCCWGSGAWETAVRYSWVDLNSPGINGGSLHDVTLGVNWYQNYNFRIQWNYVYTHREATAPVNSGDVQALVMRFSFDI